MTITIFVSGGCVQSVLGTDDYTIIDYDNLESGCCPNLNCQANLDNTEEGIADLEACPKCGMSLEEYAEYSEIHAFLQPEIETA